MLSKIAFVIVPSRQTKTRFRTVAVANIKGNEPAKQEHVHETSH